MDEAHDDGPQQQQQQLQLLQMVDSALLDPGGEVEPSQTCPHLHGCLRLPLDALPAAMARPCQGCGAEAELWVCLSCESTRCSRYVNACSEAHFFETMGGDSDTATSAHPAHALVLSLSDLSVWCYACGCYVKHDRLLPTLVRAEAIKFNAPDKTELLRGAQTSFHIGFSAPPALLRPPQQQQADDNGGGGKATPTERALERLKELSLLAKTVCPLPRPPTATATATATADRDGDGDENEYDAILAPLIHALLAGSLACGLALLDSVGPGAVVRVYDAVGRAVVAAAGAAVRRRWEVPILEYNGHGDDGGGPGLAIHHMREGPMPTPPPGEGEAEAEAEAPPQPAAYHVITGARASSLCSGEFMGLARAAACARAPAPPLGGERGRRRPRLAPAPCRRWRCCTSAGTRLGAAARVKLSRRWRWGRS